MSFLDDGWSTGHGGGGPTRNRPHGNLAALRVAVVVMFAILIAQLFRMQIIQGDDYARRSRENHITQQIKLAPRGLITDRNGEPLVENVPVYTAIILPELLPETRDERYKIYLRLEQLIGVPALEIESMVKTQEVDGRSYINVPVRKYLTQNQALRLEEASADLKGVRLDVSPGRRYPAGNEFSAMLGFIGPQTKEEHAQLTSKGYQLNEPVGKAGIESYYETDLRGAPGATAAEQDAQGRLVQALKSKDPVPGNGVQLAIDSGLQRFVTELLYDHMAGDRVNGDASVAAAVVMNAKTGEIYSLVSIPDYDNNVFVEPEKRAAEINALNHDEAQKPLLNKALNPAAPGSTFKLITASAGLETGRVTPATSRFIPKVLEVKGENGVLYPLIDWKAHGNINFTQAIAWSSNIYMFMISCGILGESRGLGKDDETSAVVLGYYARQFGLGRLTGIDVGGEAPGIIPDPAWKKRVHAGEGRDSTDWHYADTCFMGIGQGDVTATPLQIARMTAAVANGGKLLTPHVAKAIVGADGQVVRTIEPDWTQVAVSDRNLAEVRKGMHESVIGGAGARAYQPGLDIAGKTGTAEFNLPDGTLAQHAWFTGYAPFDDPEVVVTVYFDRGIGGDKAAPLGGQILSYFFAEVKKP